MNPTLGAISIFLVAGIFYFLPALVAQRRARSNTKAIFALNLLLGWTFIGWVIALVWSLTGPGGREDRPAVKAS